MEGRGRVYFSFDFLSLLLLRIYIINGAFRGMGLEKIYILVVSMIAVIDITLERQPPYLYHHPSRLPFRWECGEG